MTLSWLIDYCVGHPMTKDFLRTDGYQVRLISAGNILAWSMRCNGQLLNVDNATSKHSSTTSLSIFELLSFAVNYKRRRET